jgi:enamine deaminase RidA (YjgF/YER057c/UK114 family)
VHRVLPRHFSGLPKRPLARQLLAAIIMMAAMKEYIQRVFSHAPWEAKVGYCRAIRMGDIIAVTGTTSIDETGHVFAVGDPCRQTQKCLELIERALVQLGISRKQIIRTRMFVTDISRWEEYGPPHGSNSILLSKFALTLTGRSAVTEKSQGKNAGHKVGNNVSSLKLEKTDRNQGITAENHEETRQPRGRM